jgi:hypothetical protein
MRWGLVVLAALVLALHLVVTNQIAQNLGESRWLAHQPARMRVTYVRELALQAPVAVAAVTAAVIKLPTRPVVEPATTVTRLRVDPAPAVSIKKRPKKAQKTVEALKASASTAAASAADLAEAPASAASTPKAELLPAVTTKTTEVAASEPLLLPASPMWTESAPRRTPSRVASGVGDPNLISLNPAASSNASPAEGGFDWPASTQLSYKVTGQYRGDIYGQAQVQWISTAQRYQVHMDVTVGLPIAPLFTRRMSSDGHLTPEGLSPERYDEETKILGKPPQRHVLQFDATGVILPNGQRHDTPTHVQDPASQFVQLAYRFAHHPEALQVGGVIELDLALPRQVSRRQFDVLAQEPVYTPFGALNAFHLKMRRTSSSKSGDFDPEVWLVPELRFLPARMRIEQGDENYLDMVLMKRPEVGEVQAAGAQD